MPRKVRDSNLETRTARSKLKARAKPYYRLIEPGLHLGYRKLPSGPGTWIARRYKGEGAYTTENLRDPANNIVLADDFTDADGVRVLTFGQAQQQARRASPRSAVMTISDVLDRYIGRLDTDGRSPRDIADARTRIDAHIRPALGTITIGALTTERLRTWLADVAAAPSRLRSSTGKQKYGAVRDDRARQATANRIWAILRAALNAAFEDGKISSDTVWRRVKPFKNAGAARQRHLSVEEARRLVNACDPDFRLLVQAALQTGARYGELCRLTVADFNRDAGTIAVLKSKSGKPRHVIVTDEGRAFFGPPAVPVVRYYYVNATVARGGQNHQERPMKQAISRAKIAPPISFHGLRHTWASLSVMAGVPLMVVARNLGHADTKMVEKHYGHLAPGYVVDEIRKGAPKFGFEPDDKVTAIG